MNTLMEDIKKNSGIELNEGVKYNQFSKKINKVLARMEISVKKSQQIAEEQNVDDTNKEMVF